MGALDGKHRAWLDAMPKALCVMRPSDVTVLYANDACLRLEREEPELVAKARASLRAQLAGGGDGASEVSRTHDDGTKRWIAATGSRLHDVDLGELWLVALAEVTTFHRRFDALWRSGMVGVAIGDNHGTIREANDLYLAIRGYARADLEAGLIQYAALTPPEHVHKIARAVAQLEARGVAEPWRTEALRKDGSRVPIMVGVARIDEAQNIAIVTDLSSSARADELQRRTEEQLRHAQKMEAVGRLAGGVAHDFNNMLSVIVSYSEMLHADLGANDPMRADLAEISRAAMRASELTKQLLVFSRQEVVDPTILNPNQVVGGMDRLLQRILGEDIEVVSLLGDRLGQIEVGASHLEQCVMNLAVNARDAMPDGGKLTIETSNVDLDSEYEQAHVPAKAGPYVMLAVSDTGAGMDRETIARIFDPFFTTKAVGKGTGLGLSIVFGIVQQCGGHLWVYSEPGHGTTFKLYFPRVDARARMTRPSRPPLAPGALRGTETILLVEDEEQVRRVAHGILIRNGYRVLDAQNPGEALLLCESHDERIDLLLTDVVMPHMTGPELARRLSTLRPEMRVLFMSGYTDEGIVRHGVLERGVAFLQKPLTPETLSRKVREVLDDALGRAA